MFGLKMLENILVLLILMDTSRIDIKCRKISNTASLNILLIHTVSLFLHFFMNKETAFREWTESAVGLISGGTMFLLCYVISQHGIGAGDVKLMAALGYCYGIDNLLKLTVWIFLTAGFYITAALIVHKKFSDNRIPMAPFIATGVMIVMLSEGWKYAENWFRSGWKI